MENKIANISTLLNYAKEQKRTAADTKAQLVTYLQNAGLITDLSSLTVIGHPIMGYTSTDTSSGAVKVVRDSTSDKDAHP